MAVARHLIAAIACAIITATLLSEVSAQLVAGRPVTIVVPFTPGTGPDILARLVGDELQKQWGQPFIVENKPGATGNLGAQAVARAAPDGHTLLMTSNPFTANTSLLKNIPYDPITSFEPIVEVGVAALALGVHPSVPATSLPQLVAFLKKNPDQYHYGSPGIGGPHHLAMELFKLSSGIQVRHIPYRGSAGALQDLIGGHVQLGFVPPHTSLQLVSQGQLQLLAVASKDRIAVAPMVPTFAELGFPDIEVELWYALLAPAGMPPDIVNRYNSAVNEIIRTPEIVAKMQKQGLIPVGGTPERLAAFIQRDIAKWRNVIREAKISAE
jgi:tripartite-type tricarboxylate transporter receptor subunit TctC